MYRTWLFSLKEIYMETYMPYPAPQQMPTLST